MEVSGGRKSKRVCLDITLLLFNTVPKLVQALVIMYDEIFQAVAVEGDVLLPNPFLYLGFDDVRWTRKSPAREMFFFRLPNT
jgi:hypothetical protein